MNEDQSYNEVKVDKTMNCLLHKDILIVSYWEYRVWLLLDENVLQDKQNLCL